MKIIIVILLTLALCAGHAHAQLLVGPVAGGQLSWVSGTIDREASYDIKPVFGFHAGAMASFRVHKRFFLNTSFLYSTKGKIVEGGLDEELRNKVINRFIDVPIIYTVEFRDQVGGGKVYKWFLGIGPNVGYWLGGKGVLRNSDLLERIHFDQPYKVAFYDVEGDYDADEMAVENPNRIQLALNLAAGFAVEPGNNGQKIVFMARYEFGHSYYSRESDGVFLNSLSYRDNLRTANQGIRLSLAYMWDTKISQRKKGKSTIKKKNL